MWKHVSTGFLFPQLGVSGFAGCHALASSTSLSLSLSICIPRSRLLHTEADGETGRGDKRVGVAARCLTCRKLAVVFVKTGMLLSAFF